MDIDTYTNYEVRIDKLYQGFSDGYRDPIEGKLRAIDDNYHYTKINRKPKTIQEYNANAKYLRKDKIAVIRDIKDHLQAKDIRIRIEEFKKDAHKRGDKMRQMNEGDMQAFPRDIIPDEFFKWTTKEAYKIYKNLLEEVEEAEKEKDALIAKDEAAKLAAEQKVKAEQNAKNTEEAEDKIFPTQVERTDYDSDEEEVARRERLILITHLDIRVDKDDKYYKDGIDFGHPQASGKIKRFWVDPGTKDHKLYAFYDKDDHLGELEGYKKGVKEYAHSDINIQYRCYLRKSDQIYSDYVDGDIIITWYDEDEEYFNRQIKIKEAVLKLSEGQRRNFWNVKWSSTKNKIFYTKEGYTDGEGDLIPYFNSDELPDYDITKGDYFGVPIKKSAPAPAPASASPSIFGFTETASVAAPNQQPSASVAVPQELTNEWVEQISKSKGTTYYYNTRTTQSSWVKPPTIPQELYQIGWRTRYDTDINKYVFDFKPEEDWNTTKMPENMVRNVENLPVRKNATGWSSGLSTTRGYYYYTNNITGTTTYQDNAVKGGKKTRKGKGKGKTKKAAKGKKNTRSKKAQRNKTKTKTKTKKGSKKM